MLISVLPLNISFRLILSVLLSFHFEMKLPDHYRSLLFISAYTSEYNLFFDETDLGSVVDSDRIMSGRKFRNDNLFSVPFILMKYPLATG